MGNMVRKCRRKEGDPDLDERRLAIAQTLGARIAANSDYAIGSLPRRRRHLTAAIETFIAGKDFHSS